jgi:hypothetical protein
MNPCVRFVKYFGKLEIASAASEEEFRALKHGDRILVRLDGAELEVRKFTGFGLRHLLIATSHMGYNYDHFFVDASDPKKPHTQYHRYTLDRSRFCGLAPDEMARR